MVFNQTFWIVVIIAVFCLMTLVGVFRFGRFIYESPWRYRFPADVLEQLSAILDRLVNAKPADQAALEVTKQISNSIEVYLDRRNKFWELFGQIALAVVVVLVVAILLLTKTIDADAGLPILTAVVAFVIGKGIDAKGAGRDGGGPLGRPGPRGE